MPAIKGSSIDRAALALREKQIIRARTVDGLTVKEIAAALGISRDIVYKTLRRNGIKLDQTAPKKEQEAEADFIAFLNSRADLARKVIDTALQTVLDKLPDASAKDAATTMGIVIDKFTALHNSASRAGEIEDLTPLADLINDPAPSAEQKPQEAPQTAPDADSTDNTQKGGGGV